jgi:hypothetical protein
MSTCSRVFKYDSAEGSDLSALYWVLPLLTESHDFLLQKENCM